MSQNDNKRPAYKNFNNFDMPASNQINQNQYNAQTPLNMQYNNLNQLIQDQTNYNTHSRINVDAMSEDDLSEFIFAYVEQLYLE